MIVKQFCGLYMDRCFYLRHHFRQIQYIFFSGKLSEALCKRKQREKTALSYTYSHNKEMAD